MEEEIVKPGLDEEQDENENEPESTEEPVMTETLIEHTEVIQPSNEEKPTEPQSTEEPVIIKTHIEHTEVIKLSKEEKPTVEIIDDASTATGTNFEEIQKFLDRMAYDVPNPPKPFSPRTVKLAQPKVQYLMDTHATYKGVMNSKRAARIKRRLDELNSITTEEYQAIVKARQVDEAKRKAFLEKREKLMMETLESLKIKIRQGAMKVVVKKFSEKITNMAMAVKLDRFRPEPYQKLVNCLLYFIHEHIKGKKEPFTGVVEQSHMKVAVCLADLLVNTMLQAQKMAERDIPISDLFKTGTVTPSSEATDRVTELKRRAKLAAHKKARRNSRETRMADFSGFSPINQEILKLSTQI